MNNHDGGSAFPQVRTTITAFSEDGLPLGSGITGFSAGMTLRDYFAAAAVAGVLREFYDPEGQNLFSWDHVAEEVYGMADAMLAERQKASGE